ncbi:MAG TPA: hypothetical protein VGQ36_00710 [Thermoanaerobaculia bacterium]|jgi:hypothetical protein|nr:hypothetical protein [Thermoanaerobaculia bacterium]
MSAYRRQLISAAFCVLAACGHNHDEGTIRHLSGSIRLDAEPHGPTRRFDTIELTLPRDFAIDKIGSTTLIDAQGRRYRPSSMGLNPHANGEATVIGTFEVTENAEPKFLHIGDLWIDLDRSHVRRLRAPPPAP